MLVGGSRASCPLSAQRQDDSAHGIIRGSVKLVKQRGLNLGCSPRKEQ
jgi:hypothetical protein